MDIDQVVLMEVFLADGAEYVGTAEDLLMLLEQRPADREALAGLFRVIHTIKGDSAIVGVTQISELAHHMEDFLDAARSGAKSLDSEAISVLLASVDVVKEMIVALSSGRPTSSVSQARAVGELQRLLRKEPSPAGGLAGTDHQAETGQGNGAVVRANTLRVDVNKLDRMLEILGEIAAGRAKVNRDLSALGAAGRSVLESQSAADRLHTDLHELVLRLRMVPIEPVLRQYVRTVRDIAKEQNKIVNLVVEAGEVEVDTSVVERLREPLTHLVRNAVDHGVETTSERAVAGKDAAATIMITAKHEMSHIVITVQDDGRGINCQRVLERARELGMVGADDRPDDDSLLDMVFQPGFSTATCVSKLSGRGVGMDAVFKSVSSLRGSVSLSSSENRGCAVTLRIPLTLARGFAVEVDDEVYVVPLEAVVECVQAPPEVAGNGKVRGVFDYRDGVLPYVRLRSFFSVAGTAETEDVVVVRHEGLRAGLVVDRLRGEAQTAAQPLHRILTQEKAISGAAVLEDGSLALLLDVTEAIRIAGLGLKDDNDSEHGDHDLRPSAHEAHS